MSSFFLHLQEAPPVSSARPAAGFCNKVSLGNARSDGDNERSRTLPSPNDERYSLSSWIR